MKKLMIIMLAIAMLFSFIACDNSSKAQDDQQLEEENKPDDQQPSGGGTPATPSQGGGDSQPQAETFTEEEIASIAKTIADLFTGDDNGLLKKFDDINIQYGDEPMLDGYTCDSPYRKIVYEYTPVVGSSIRTEVTITIEGTEMTKEEYLAENPHLGEENVDLIFQCGTITSLNRYTVNFTTEWNQDGSSEYSKLSGWVSGKIDGRLSVQQETIIPGLPITPPNMTHSEIDYVIMPDTTSVTVDGVDSVPESKLVAAFNADEYVSGKYTTTSAYAATENQ